VRSHAQGHTQADWEEKVKFDPCKNGYFLSNKRTAHQVEGNLFLWHIDDVMYLIFGKWED
jgi:hypothetical protein